MKKPVIADKPTVYQIVTDRILASLKGGILPWEKPWTTPTWPYTEISAKFAHRADEPSLLRFEITQDC